MDDLAEVSSTIAIPEEWSQAVSFIQALPIRSRSISLNAWSTLGHPHR